MKKKREKTDKNNPLMLVHYQIREDQDKALKEKAESEGVAVQKLVRDAIDEKINMIRT